jgi:hypothetical protein
MAASFRLKEGETGSTWVGRLGMKGRAGQFQRKKNAGHNEVAGRNVNGLQKLFFIFKQGFWIQNQRVQIFLN